jgi:ABC-type amino acid transport substrate-binding protein
MKAWLASLLLALPLWAAAAELRFIAPTNLAEPLARFENGQLRGGLLKDLGDALASRLGRQARYVSMPSKRVAQALMEGDGQMVCYVMPGWIDGDLDWTLPVIPDAEVVAARRDAPPVQSLEDLRSQRVGTVLGYRYPHLLAPGRSQLPFHRFDAPDTRANLAKLLAGRMPYALVDELALRDFMRRRPGSGLRVDLVVTRYTAPCALARGSGLQLEQVNRALAALLHEGEVARWLRRYGS